MKIGIITFVEGNCNYGGVFQSVALQDFLCSMGHDAVLLRIRYEKRKPFLKLFLERPAKAILERTKAGRFAPFRSRHVRAAGFPCYSLREFFETPPAFDAFVCGSDQIWNPGFCADPDKRRLFFLDFGPDSAKRVAYAASWGSAETDPALQDELARLLGRLNAISVREKSGIGLVRRLGGDAVWLPDPTLLHPMSYWSAMADEAERPAREGILFKCEYRWTPLVPFAEIESLVNAGRPLKTVIPFSNRPFRENAMTRCLSPEEWLSTARSAAFVLTNSYHATLFSIIFHRPFLVIPLVGKYAGMNERIYSVTEKLGLQDRIVTDGAAGRIQSQIAAPIDWDAVDRKRAAWQQEGLQFLSSEL